jgi:hypothetical protein
MNYDDETREKLTKLITFASLHGQNIERSMRFGVATSDSTDPHSLTTELQKHVFKGAEIVVKSIKKPVFDTNSSDDEDGEEQEETERTYDGYLLCETGDFDIEIRPEGTEFQVIVWRPGQSHEDTVRNSGYVTSHAQVVDICAKLEKVDFLGAMRILFASYAGMTRSSSVLDTLAKASLFRSTISALEL